MDIEFEGQFEQDQYIRAIKKVITPSKLSTILRAAAFLAALALIIYLYFHGMQDGALNQIENNRVRLSLFGGGLLTLYLVTPYLGINSTANRLWKKPSVQRVKTGTISTEGITYGDKLKPWGHYIRKYIYPDMVLLLTADEGMSLLPRQFFRDEMDWKRFLQMVEQYAVNAKHVKK